jgi:dTDP-4-dehydrorhamnose 3,5-epimerase
MPPLPLGVEVDPLRPIHDARGSLTELYRASGQQHPLVQFNLVQSAPGVLRGVHVHLDHTDHLIGLAGTIVVGLHDLRRDSPTFRQSASVVLSSTAVVRVAPGIAHGFWFPSGGTLMYGLDHEWTPDDDFGCRWDDPDLSIPWSPDGIGDPHDLAGGPMLSQRDSSAISLAQLSDRYAELTSVAG